MRSLLDRHTIRIAVPLWVCLSAGACTHQSRSLTGRPSPPIPPEPTKKPVPTPTDTGPLELHEIRVITNAGQRSVMFRFSRPLENLHYFSLSAPSRLVIDITGPIEAQPQVAAYEADEPQIASVRVISSVGHIRLVIELALDEALPVSVDAHAAILTARIGRKTKTADSKHADTQILFIAENADLTQLDRTPAISSEAKEGPAFPPPESCPRVPDTSPSEISLREDAPALASSRSRSVESDSRRCPACERVRAGAGRQRLHHFNYDTSGGGTDYADQDSGSGTAQPAHHSSPPGCPFADDEFASVDPRRRDLCLRWHPARQSGPPEEWDSLPASSGTGWPFRGKVGRRTQDGLLIFLTPKIVAGVSTASLPSARQLWGGRSTGVEDVLGEFSDLSISRPAKIGTKESLCWKWQGHSKAWMSSTDIPKLYYGGRGWPQAFARLYQWGYGVDAVVEMERRT